MEMRELVANFRTEQRVGYIQSIVSSGEIP
jgi:hypothetical protein